METTESDSGARAEEERTNTECGLGKMQPQVTVQTAGR